MNKYDLIILLDAVKFNESAGVLRIFTPDEVKSLKPDQNFSTHNQDFFQIIEIAKRLKQNHAHFLIAGIQPADLSFGEGLSKELINRMDIIKNKLLEALINL